MADGYLDLAHGWAALYEHLAADRREIDRPVYWLYRLCAGVFSWLPEPVARKMGEWAGWTAWIWSASRKQMAIRHARRVMGLPADGPDGDYARTVRRRARSMFRAYGRYWAEVFWLTPRRVESLYEYVEVEGLENVRPVIEQGVPIVAALPHLGNWEIAGTLARIAGVNITAVAESLPNRYITEWFVRVRAALSIKIILAERSSGRQFFEALKPKGVLALVSDRDLTGKGVEVEFFGENTTLPAGPASLAIRTGSALVPVAVFFKPGRGHQAVIQPPINILENATPSLVTAELASCFEDLIKRAPEQWHLVQPNWPSDQRFLAAGQEKDG